MEFEAFTRWITENRNSTSISSWLIGSDNYAPSVVPLTNGFGSNGFQLSDDHETPTFYQTLAGVTHCMFLLTTNITRLFVIFTLQY